MRLRSFLPVLGLLCATAASHAASMTYNFTYNGTGTYSGASDKGSGSLTYTYTTGSSTGMLSAFNFTDTLQTSGGVQSIFTYSGLTSLFSSSVVLNAMTGQIATLSLTTNYLLGSNTSFGPANFTLNYSGPTTGSTMGSNAAATNFYSTFSTGSGALTLAPVTTVTPEPSSMALLGTGLLGVAGIVRKRLA